MSLAQNTAIPDPIFEQELINLGVDSAPINGFVPTVNIASITNLDVSGKNISNLTGIEAFTNLSVLNCGSNLLTALDVSKNTKLTELYVDNNQISVLDVSNLTNLKIFWCYSNRLSNLNVTKNTNLISLVCWNNNLTSLNTSNNTKLNVLVCELNKISSLNIMNNKGLSRFQCGKNLLNNLDVSNNTQLAYLSCEENFLASLDVSNNKELQTVYCQNNQISELDLSQQPNLKTLDCSSNLLCQLNLKNGNNSNADVNFSNNLNLNCVVVDTPSNTSTTWLPTGFSNYVNAQNQCSNFVNIDTLASVITNNPYTLPALTYGNYFTQSNGAGTPLYAGDVITTSQTIYIYNTSVCATNESKFTVLVTTEDYYIPKYFTPNNDGIHDVWKVEDFNNTINNITIFDRNGKLLKQLPSNNLGWNGTFNGNVLETNDYWYIITLNTGETLKGHFTLKR